MINFVCNNCWNLSNDFKKQKFFLLTDKLLQANMATSSGLREVLQQFCSLTTPFQPLLTIMCLCSICKEPSRYYLTMFIANKENFRCKPTKTDITRCLDPHDSTLCTSKHHHVDMSWKGYRNHHCKKICTHSENTYCLQCHFTKFLPTTYISDCKLGC